MGTTSYIRKVWERELDRWRGLTFIKLECGHTLTFHADTQTPTAFCYECMMEDLWDG